MTPPDWLAAIRARCAAATKGPWQVCPDENTDGDLPLVCLGHGDEHGGPICTHPLTPDDATFIAHARADVPALLDLVEALAGALEEAQAILASDELAEMQSVGWAVGVRYTDEFMARCRAAKIARIAALARYAAGSGA